MESYMSVPSLRMLTPPDSGKVKNFRGASTFSDHSTLRSRSAKTYESAASETSLIFWSF
jgi:hypothetical protein